MTNTSSISTTTDTKQQNKIVYKVAARGKEIKEEDKITSSSVPSASGSVVIIYPNQKKPVLVYNIEQEREKMLRKDIKEILED